MIGVLDSGIGGATVLKRIREELPHYTYLYYSDSKNNPYGSKTKEEVYSIVSSIVDYFLQHKCTVIVLACNTATAYCIDTLRQNYPKIVFIGTEPACKVIYDYHYYENTLLLATEGTIGSDRFSYLIKKYSTPHMKTLACPRLASLIEQNKKEEIYTYLNTILSPYKGIQNIILGCTHYPLVSPIIQEILGDITIIDSSYGIAEELKRQIHKKRVEETSPTILYFDSSNNPLKRKQFEEIIEYNSIQQLKREDKK